MANGNGSNLPVLAASRGLDLATASQEDLVRVVERMQLAASQGWLDRVYQVNVELSKQQGHIYTLGKARRDDEEPAAWAIQGPGFDMLNRAAGVTVTTVSEVIEWDGIIPRTITIRRIAVGYTSAGVLRVAPVELTVHGKHYRFERIHKAAGHYVKGGGYQRTEGFAFGTKAQLIGEKKLGGPHQIWLRTETLGEGDEKTDIGYALDTTVQKVREVLEDGATFGKNLSRAATTIAGRLASTQWHGFSKLKTSWVRESGSDTIAVVPVTGWRSELQREQIEKIATEIAHGADIAQATSAAGIRAEKVVEPVQTITVANPEATDEEHDELAEADIAPAAAPEENGAQLELTTPPATTAAPDPVVELGPTKEPEPPAAPAQAPGMPNTPGTVADLKRLIRGYIKPIDSGDYGTDNFKAVLARIGSSLGLGTHEQVKDCTDVQRLGDLVTKFATFTGEV
jgi:hypothetical protein